MAGWFYSYYPYPNAALSMSQEKTMPVHELFHAFQGEGHYMGCSALFIRTFGCPVKCPWCDSAGTWHPRYVPGNIARMTREALEQEVAKVADEIEFVVLTGGEPCVHPEMLLALQDICEAYAVPLHIETCGAFLVEGILPSTWVTLSPKWDKPPVQGMLDVTNEIKIIVEDPGSIGRWERFFDTAFNLELHEAVEHVWLHPEWSQRTNKEVLTSITNAVKRNGFGYRAGWQLHKLYQCDALDTRTRPLAPLGGNPDLGY